MRAALLPEFELLLRCARTQLTDDHAAAIRRLAASGLDWKVVLALAQRHGVEPLVYRALARAGPATVPAPAMQKLKSLDDSNRVRTLVLIAELRKALAALRAAGIPTLIQKGPPLAVALYSDTTSRVSFDVDFRVKARDAVEARRVFIGLGYEPYRRVPERMQHLYVRMHYEFAFFTSERRGPDVELHWRDAPWYFGLPQVPDAAWDRLGDVSLGGNAVPCLAPADLLLDLALHGSRHKWRALKWLVDIAEFMRVHADLDWTRVMQDARRAGAQRMVALAIYLAQDLLDAPVPQEVSRTLERMPELPALADEVYRSLIPIEGEPGSEVFTLPFVARAADRLSARVLCRALVVAYFVLHRLIRPSLAVLRRASTR